MYGILYIHVLFIRNMMDISSEDDSQVKVIYTVHSIYTLFTFYESTCHKYYEY